MSSAFWKKFLIDAGIPVKAADSYTSAFVDNRITESMIPDINKSVLIDLGITIIGDVIAILKHAIHLTEEASAEKLRKKQPRPADKKKATSERTEKKIRKPGPDKKIEKTTPTKVEPEVKTREEKAVSKAVQKKPIPPPEKTEKPPRKVRITDQVATTERTNVDHKPVPSNQEVKRAKPRKETPSTRTVSVPTKPSQTTTRKVSSAAPNPAPSDKPAITQLVRKVAAHVKSSEPAVKSAAPTIKHVTPAKNVTTIVRNVSTTSAKHRSAGSAVLKHVVEEPGSQQRTHVKRQLDSAKSDDSGSSSDERSPVMRRVFGGHTSRDTEVARDVMRVPARAKESRDFSSEDDTSPVVVRRAHAMQTPNSEPVITRLLPEDSHSITRNVSGNVNVKRTVQTVRCVSPDSTTDTPPPKPKQTTTIILNTKGKCSVRPVSPPGDMKLERKRKVMPRDDGKTALTRVVQRHLDSSSPHRSPKRNKNTPPVKRSDNKEIGSLKSEKFNSFRSDAEESESRSNNKFRSEDDSFDVVSEQRAPVRRKVRSRSLSGGRLGSSLSRRLGSARGADLRKSLPTRGGGVAARMGGVAARMGGVAARVFSENRLSQNRDSGRLASLQSSGIFRAQNKERSVFSRLGD
ncbi:hypothetical protein ACHWQZ_G003439 [Mnemiopsis leidyi]